MAKRQAEIQLTDSNCNDPEDDDTPSTGILKTASPQVISRRQIRALPKKSGSSVSTAPSKIGAAPSLSTNGNLVSTSCGQASQLANPTPSINLFGGSSSFGTAMTNSSSSTETQNTQALITHYASLRGLNLCVLKAFDGLVKKDTFMDLSSAFDHVKKTYNQHRREIEAELERLEPSAANKTNISPTAEAPIKSSFSFATNGAQNEAPVKSPFSLATNRAQNGAPVKPAFSLATKGPQNASSNGLSTVAEACTTASPFFVPANGAHNSLSGGSSFEHPSVPGLEIQPPSDEVGDQDLPSANSLTAPVAKAGSRPGAFTMAAPMRPSPLRYESQDPPAGCPPPEPCDPLPKSPASLAAKTERSKPESLLSSRPDTANQKPKPNEGNSADSPVALSLLDSQSKSTSLLGTTGKSAAGTSVFGGSFTSKPFSLPSPSTQNSPANPPSVSFGFGVGGAGNGSAFGGFGSPKAVQATPPKNGFNPVGFSFGSSPPTSSVFSTNPQTPSIFSTKAPDPPSSEPGSTTNNSSSTADDKPKSDSDSLTEQKTSDEMGASTELKAAKSNKGEEEEETVFESTGRVYALLDKKQEDGKIQKNWVGWAVCNVKLNRHKESKRCRLLARSQVNQGILINFFLRPDLKPENRGNSLEVLGFNPEGTQLQAYRIRPSSIQMVGEFIKAIKDVVATLPKS